MKELVKQKIIEAAKKSGYSIPQNFSIEVPPKSEMGDYATNIAMIIAGRDKSTPRVIAEKIINSLKAVKEFSKVEIAGPGFINIFLSDAYLKTEFEKILELKENYGRGSKKKSKIQVEHVSANPTGPLHVGNARGGPIGEALAGLFGFLGYEVEREFYINDVGGQVNRFGDYLYYWFAVKEDEKINFPEGGYPGAYIKEISEKIQQECKQELTEIKDKEDFLRFFTKEGIRHTLKSIREDCLLLDIKFDNWVNQSDFRSSGRVDKIIERMEELGLTVKKEGALWFKSPDDPDLKDRESVLKKSDDLGSTTYFTDDIAYHVDKFERGFDKVINVWGANHAGHVDRFRAALRALGYSDDKIHIILYQYVRLKNAGQVVSMGKRLGNFVTLRQVIESGVAPDAFKYFILAQNPNTPFDFDLKLAADTSEKNPVFYIKYAHARICSILDKWDETRQQKGDRKASKGSRTGTDFDQKGIEAEIEKADFSLLNNPKEVALYKELVRFPELLNEISEDFQIQALPHFSYKIATLFHDFYANCQVLGVDKKIEAARLSLVVATKYVLANALQICGIEAPEKM